MRSPRPPDATDHPLPAAAIGAVIAAAGMSRRMGTPKQLLAWPTPANPNGTVIQAVVANLRAGGATPVVCVIGHQAAEMRVALRTSGAQLVYNAGYADGEMLHSYQVGLAALAGHDPALAGALVALSDQPHVGAEVSRTVVAQARRTPTAIVIPSFAQRRGHPFFLPAVLWPAVAALPPGQSMRDLLRTHEARIVYVTVDNDAILRDMDTPAAYAARRAEQNQTP